MADRGDGVAPTLELIDNAITDYRLSVDAMRWSPDGFPDPPGPITTLPQVEVRFEFDASAFTEGVASVQAAFQSMGEAFSKALAELRPPTPEAVARRARLRRMHSSYPAKWGKRQ